MISRCRLTLEKLERASKQASNLVTPHGAKTEKKHEESKKLVFPLFLTHLVFFSLCLLLSVLFFFFSQLPSLSLSPNLISMRMYIFRKRPAVVLALSLAFLAFLNGARREEQLMLALFPPSFLCFFSSLSFTARIDCCAEEQLPGSFDPRNESTQRESD